MSIIENGLRADVFRNRVEDKNALQNLGDIYVGTGVSSRIDGVNVQKTEGKNIIDAINEAQRFYENKKVETPIKSAELKGTTLILTI